MTKQFIKHILSEILFGNRLSESIIQYNDINFLYDKLMLEKLLIGEPVSLPELRDILNKKILNFEFVKIDGEVRPARGTTMMKYIPKDDQPSGMHPSSDKVAAFFDLDKQAWRSVSNKSREIILDKDEVTGKPKVVVSDKKPKEEPKPGEIVKGKAGKIMKQPVAPVKPIVKPTIVPTIKPKVPKPEDIIIPGEEETPLDILDPTIVADTVKDKDILAPDETQEKHLYDLDVDLDSLEDDVVLDDEEELTDLDDEDELEDDHELSDIEDTDDDLINMNGSGPVRIN